MEACPTLGQQGGWGRGPCKWLPIKTRRAYMGSGLGSASQEERLEAKAQPEMASAKDEFHSEDATLE